MKERTFGWITAPLANHWRGQNALLPTILFSVIGLRLVVGTIPVQASFPVALAVVGLSCGVLIWQVVGTWRTMNIDLGSFGNPFVSWIGYGALIVAGTLTVFQVIDQISGKYEARNDPALTPYLETVSNANGHPALLIDGDIDYDTNRALLNTIAKFPDARSVHLSSEGGLIYAARTLARTIEKRGLNTHIEAKCFSACTLAFLAGKTRTMAPQAKLGFHRYALEKVHPLQIASVQEQQEIDLAYFRGRGVAEHFLKLVFQSPHEKIWFPDRATLLKNRVLSAP